MKTVFLCTPHKLGSLNHELIARIRKAGYDVLCAVTHSPQDVPGDTMFMNNVDLIRKADIFVAVLKDYGKDLTAEVGMAYAWRKPSIGIDFNADEKDVMSYRALDRIVKPEDLESALASVRFAKTGKSKRGQTMHYSMGALIKRDEKYLLIDRVKPPLGFAGLAGHVDEEESPEDAVIREVKEESGLGVKSYKLLFDEELEWDLCSRGVNVHHWHLFECEVSGKIERDPKEARSIGWYSPEQIRELNLEPAWAHWFRKLNIIP